MNPTPTPAPAGKGWRIVLLVAAALAVLLVAGPALIKFTEAAELPRSGTFDIGVLEVPVLGAFQFFAAVSIAFAAYYALFHKLYAYVRDCMEEKLFSTLTTTLVDQLPKAELATLENIAHAAEARHIAQFQFRIRCVRFLLSLLPFFFLLAGSLFIVNNALTAVPR